eukprot:1176873-Prorocentrum_minimum.AAC.6
MERCGRLLAPFAPFAPLCEHRRELGDRRHTQLSDGSPDGGHQVEPIKASTCEVQIGVGRGRWAPYPACVLHNDDGVGPEQRRCVQQPHELRVAHLHRGRKAHTFGSATLVEQASRTLLAEYADNEKGGTVSSPAETWVCLHKVRLLTSCGTLGKVSLYLSSIGVQDLPTQLNSACQTHKVKS